MAADIAQLGFEITTTDLERGTRELNRLSDSARNAGKTADTVAAQFRKLALSFGLGLGVREVLKYADAWVSVNSRLQLVTDSHREFLTVQKQLFDLAQRTRTSYEGTVDLYTRIARSTKQMNIADGDRLRVTETINKALLISGSSAASAKAALTQLGQAFASGQLRGQELNSVMEQTPRLSQAIADGLGVGLGRMRAMAKEGQLTSEVVFKAILSQEAAVGAEAGRMTRTVAQSFEVLKNSVMRFIGETDSATGVTRALGGALVFVGTHLNTVITALTAYMGIKYAAKAQEAVTAYLAEARARQTAAAAAATQAAAERASIQASLARNAATLSNISTTQAAVIAARADVTAKLAQTDASIVQARAQIAATAAMGAQSAALAANITATNALAVAESRRAALITEMAVLGRQQSSLAAQATVATSAQAAAQAKLSAQVAGGAAATGLMSRAVAFLGGRLMTWVTLLGTAAVAWSAWSDAGGDASASIKSSISDAYGTVAEYQRAFWSETVKLAQSGVGAVANLFTLLPKSAQESGASVFAHIADVFTRAYGYVKGALVTVAQIVGTFLKETGNIFVGSFAAIGKWIGTVAGGIVEYFRQGFVKILDMAKALGAGLRAALSGDFTFTGLREAFSKERLTFSKVFEDASNIRKEAFSKDYVGGFVQSIKDSVDNTRLLNSELSRLQNRAPSQDRQAIEEAKRGALTTEWLGKYATQAEKLTAKLNEARTAFGGMIPPDVEKRIRESFDKVGRGAAGAASKAAIEGLSQQAKLIEVVEKQALRDADARHKQRLTSDEEYVKEKLAIELAGIDKQSALIEQKSGVAMAKDIRARQKYAGELAKLEQQRLNLTKQANNELETLLAERRFKEEADHRKSIESIDEQTAKIQDQVATYDQSVGVHEKLASAITAVQIARLQEQADTLRSIELSGKEQEDMLRKVGFIEQEIDARQRLYGQQTQLEALDASSKAAKKAADEWNSTAKSIEEGLYSALAKGGEGGAKKIVSMLKDYFSRLVLSVPLQAVGRLGASFLNPGAAQSAGMPGFGGMSGGGDLLGSLGKLGDAASSFFGGGSAASSLGGVGLTAGNAPLTGMMTQAGDYGMAAAYGTDAWGSAAAGSTGMGSVLPVIGQALSAYGVAKEHGPLAGMAAGAGSVALGGAVTGLASGAGMGAGAIGALGAVPGWGWGLMAAGALIGGMDEGPEQNTTLKFGSSRNAVTGSTSTGRNQTGGNYVGGAGVNTAFGSFGLTDQFWMDALHESNRKGLDAFLASVKQTDDAMARYVTSAERERVTAALDATTQVAQTGAEGSDPSSQYAALFAVRIASVMDSVEDGLSGLITGLTGGAEQLGAEATAILAARKNIAEFTRTFDQAVTLQQLAALRKDGEATSTAIQRLSMTFKMTSDLATMLGKDARQAFGAVGMASEAARTRLVDLAGGLDALQSSTQFFVTNFLSEAEQMRPAIERVRGTMVDLGLSSVTTKDQFKKIVQGLNLSTEAGAEMYAKLMAIAPAFAQVADYANAGADAAASAFEQASASISAARSALTEAYGRESAALVGLIDKFTGLATSLTKFRDSLSVGELSNLSPETKYLERKRQFEATSTLAQSGDAAAMEQLQGVSEAFLQSSKEYFASSAGYTQDFNSVKAAVEQSARAATAQTYVAQRQLDELNNSVQGLITVNESVLSVRDAINALSAASRAAGGVGMAGTPTTQTLASGVQVNTFRDELGNTPFTPNLPTNSDVVSMWYQNALGRAPDPEGLRNWEAALADPTNSQRDVKAMFAQSAALETGGTPLSINAFARGGMAGMPGEDMALVGEDGPEFVKFKHPTRVFSHAQSKSMVQSMPPAADMADLKKVEEYLAALLATTQAANVELINEARQTNRELGGVRRRAELESSK